MKNAFKVLGIIAIVAMIGFSMISCGGDDGGDGNGGGGAAGGGGGDSGSGDSSGKLTITGLTEFNNKYAVAFAEVDNDSAIVAAQSLTGSTNGKGGKISNGSVTLNVYQVTGENTISDYKGSDKVDFLVMIFAQEAASEETEPIGGGTVSVTFSNGTGSGKFEEVDEDYMNSEE